MKEARMTLQTALEKGGNVLLDQLGKSRRARIKKSISSVVTDADLTSERAILEVLSNASQSWNIISEESGYVNRHSAFTWVVDPLDGTSNFAARLPWFGVIIALFREETPILGGMYLPVIQHLYFAESGKGATLNGEVLQTTASTKPAENLVAYSFDFSDTPGKTASEMAILQRLSKKVRNIRSTNSLVDFCYTADGRLGAAMNQSTKIWDIAAPWLIINEAGGKVTDIQGQEISFDLSEASANLNYTILASGKGLHQPLCEIIHLE